VTGKNGAYDLQQPFEVKVETAPSVCTGVAPIGTAPVSAGSTAKTVIVWDSGAIAAETPAERSTLATRLASLATATEGTVVDLSGNSRILQLRAQAASKPACVYAQNLVASAIRDVVQSYRNSNLTSVVLVGGDSSIPFFRYPDPSDLAPENWYVPPVKSSSVSEASLRSNYVLGQDEYGATTTLLLGETRVPVPDLAVGRLVETAAGAPAQIYPYPRLRRSAPAPPPPPAPGDRGGAWGRGRRSRPPSLRRISAAPVLWAPSRRVGRW